MDNLHRTPSSLWPTYSAHDNVTRNVTETHWVDRKAHHGKEFDLDLMVNGVCVGWVMSKRDPSTVYDSWVIDEELATASFESTEEAKAWVIARYISSLLLG